MLFTNVKAENVKALLAELAKDHTVKVNKTGVDSNPVYEIYGHDIKALADYTPASETMSIELVKKPFYITVGVIHDQLVKMLEAPAAETPDPNPAPVPQG